MRKKQVRLIAYVVCMAAAISLTIGLLLYQVIFPVPQRFTSAHSASPVPPLMGFAADSVINKGDAKALDALPGIGPVLSQRIIELRAEINDYQIPEDLLLVKGIGSKTLEAMMAALQEPLVEILLQED